MQNNKKINRHTFEHGAMSIIQLGEELIGHPSTAINELVKNGYDADATECYVYIHIDNNKSFLIVYDDGLGMSNEILFGDWLHPSISKKREPGAKSQIFERSFLGNKGIGRLAAMALGKILTVVSKTNNENKFNWVSLNSDLFRSEKLISKINFPGDQIDEFQNLFTDTELLELRDTNINNTLIELISDNKFFKSNEGTLVIIENIDQSLLKIFERDFDEQNENQDLVTFSDTTIYRGLSILITPLKLSMDIQNELLTKSIIDKKKKIAKDKSTFDLFFGTNKISSNQKFDFIPVKPINILQKFDYRVIGKVTSTGEVNGKFVCKRLKEHGFSEGFLILNNEVFDQEYKKLKMRKKPEELSIAEWNKSAGEFYFDIRIYDRGEEDSKNKLYNLIQANSLSQKKKIVDDLLGFRISKNGFGVKPYGEEIKDWLGLGQLRVQNPGQNVSTNQILGYIFFYSPENDGLKEKTNREGFYENKSFIDVKHILQVIFKNIGRLRYNFRLKNNLGRIPHNRLQRPDTEAYIHFIKQNPDHNLLMKKSDEFVQEITTALDNMEDTLSFSQRLASLGTGLELVYHELTQPISKIGGAKTILANYSNKINNINTRNMYIKEISNIGNYIAQLEELKTSLKPAIGKSRPRKFKPLSTFKKVCYLFKKDFQEDLINLIIEVEADEFEITDYEYSLWITFLNIINNAVYWLKLDDKKNKTISFKIDNNDSILVANNGPYIPEDSISSIFEYGFTLRKEKNATGLGLAFSKNILNLNNWEISADNRIDGPVFIISKRNKDA